MYNRIEVCTDNTAHLPSFFIDYLISVQHTFLCPKEPSIPYLHNGGSCNMRIYSLILLCVNTVGLSIVIYFATTRGFNRYNCKLLPRDDYINTCQCSHNLSTITLGWPSKCRSLATPKVGFLFIYLFIFIFMGVIGRCSQK